MPTCRRSRPARPPVLFSWPTFPDQVQLLTIDSRFKMGFRPNTGEGRPPSPSSTRRPASRMRAWSAGRPGGTDGHRSLTGRGYIVVDIPAVPGRHAEPWPRSPTWRRSSGWAPERGDIALDNDPGAGAGGRQDSGTGSRVMPAPAARSASSGSRRPGPSPGPMAGGVRHARRLPRMRTTRGRAAPATDASIPVFMLPYTSMCAWCRRPPARSTPHAAELRHQRRDAVPQGRSGRDRAGRPTTPNTPGSRGSRWATAGADVHDPARVTAGVHPDRGEQRRLARFGGRGERPRQDVASRSSIPVAEVVSPFGANRPAVDVPCQRSLPATPRSDVMFRPTPGSALDYASILDAGRSSRSPSAPGCDRDVALPACRWNHRRRRSRWWSMTGPSYVVVMCGQASRMPTGTPARQSGRHAVPLHRQRCRFRRAGQDRLQGLR